MGLKHLFLTEAKAKKKRSPLGVRSRRAFLTPLRCVYVESLTQILVGLLGLTTMKKDKELPWVIRLARWLALIYAVGYVAHCFMNWFF
uniref:Uncharacterized protein n=1 Tax=Myoviridae sp. ctK7P4 TaxID=2825080 RepID=A0A8S5QHJ8_9CAUD|nr:MAG TPA: hypothetical protein [Myoviridae sp. ctK7P4]